MGWGEIADTVGGRGEYGAGYRECGVAERIFKDSQEYEENRNRFQPPSRRTRMILGLIVTAFLMFVEKVVECDEIFIYEYMSIYSYVN